MLMLVALNLSRRFLKSREMRMTIHERVAQMSFDLGKGVIG